MKSRREEKRAQPWIGFALPWALALGVALGCTNHGSTSTERAATGAATSGAATSAELSATSASSPSGQAAASAAPPANPGGPSTAATGSSTQCPEGMLPVPGGEFWVGTPGTRGLPDEHPRFLTRVPSLCVDRTEVTVAAYTRCVEEGHCQAKARPRITCNFGREDRQNHPVNCLNWEQANTYCQTRGARLPTEVEWEYFARGGSEYRKFSWGDAEPDGHTCWKQAFSCPVASYPAGAFGLFDVAGNVWEWTQSNHGDYPWPARESPHKVYRGGSWSRRFDKWLFPQLRNRDVPGAMGSHLGMRCVTLLPGAACPYGELGAGAEPGAMAAPLPSSPLARTCPAGVDDAECPKGKRWNGVRCARPNEPECPDGTHVEAGFGCQVPLAIVAAAASHSSHSDQAAAGAIPIQTRSPAFDEDCRRFQPERPKAFRLEGASHKDRNLFASSRHCKNRDVGATWNSVCCP